MFDFKEHKKRTEWYCQDRLGVFVHWGLYSIVGEGEWSRTNRRFSNADYHKLMEEFTAEDYNPRDWARLAKAAGMKYAVMTAKHHDGFCLFDSKYTDFKCTNTPAGRDLIKEYVEAFRAEGLKVGIYYSLLDWDHPDYPRDRIHPNRQEGVDRFEGVNFENYLEYMHLQVKELLTNYGKIDLLWFDFSYDDMVGEMWKATELTRMIRNLQPHILIDSRLDAYEYYFGSLGEENPKEYCGDFLGAECIVPEHGFKNYKGEFIPWECCLTISDSWSHNHKDTGAKSLKQIVRCTANVVSKGGNLLWGVAPTPKGDIPVDTKKALLEFGEWIKLNGESIYGCTAADRPKPENGFLTAKGKTLYYHIIDKNVSLDPLYGIHPNEVESISLLADGTVPPIPKGAEHIVPYHYSDTIYINLLSNSKLPDPIDTVVKIQLK